MNEPTPLTPPRRGEILDPAAPDFAYKAAVQWGLYGENWIKSSPAALAEWIAAHPGEIEWHGPHSVTSAPDSVWTRRQPRRFWWLSAWLRKHLTLACESMHEVFGGDDEVARFRRG